MLVHSPLVGPLTWKLVAEEMQKRDIHAVVPGLIDSPKAEKPFWKQHAESVAKDLAGIPKYSSLIFVAHSGAGPLLPVIREALANPVKAYAFVDAGLPRDGATRLDLMRSEDANWAKEFQQYLENGGRFPNWSSEDLREILPDDEVREQLVAETHPRGLGFFTEPIPVFGSWPDAPCIYILFSEPYKGAATEAREWDWPTYKLPAGHFHMLMDPKTVTDLIVGSVNSLSSYDE